MCTTPARSAGSSVVALSVSSSSSTSSRSTLSPSPFAQRTITASVIDSPSGGTLTSNMTPPLYSRAKTRCTMLASSA
jgi:hypothetical protein